VSYFYLSKYFDARAKGGARYSFTGFTGALTKPRQVLQGGYLSWRAPDGHWWQQTWFSGAQPTFVDLGPSRRG
jgi:hypothetical protein